MKKLFAILTIAVLTANCFVGCGKTVEADKEAELSNKVAYESVTEESDETLTSKSTTEHPNSANDTTSSTKTSANVSESQEYERILVEHDGVKVYMSKEDSDYIKSVIDSFQFTADAMFSDEKDYIIHYKSACFSGEEIYYDVSTSEDDASMNKIGNNSVQSIPQEEKAKFDSILAEYFNG